MTLAERIDQLCEKHGSLRSAARAIQSDAGYLSRLAAGEKINPSERTLKKLGLKKVITYMATPPTPAQKGR